MLKYFIDRHGSSITIGIKGETKKEVLEQYYSFWNRGATNGEIEWLDDTGPSFFALFHILTDSKANAETKLSNALVDSQLFRILDMGGDKAYKGVKGGARSAAKETASKILEEMTPIRFYHNRIGSGYSELSFSFGHSCDGNNSTHFN